MIPSISPELLDKIRFNITEIESLDSLDKLLSYFHVKINEGSVKNLFQEINRGDSRLIIEKGILHRHVRSVNIKCFYTNDLGERLQLIEEKQLLKNGEVILRRHDFVDEKLQFDESPEQGALRGLEEELQVSGPGIQVVLKPEDNKFSIANSAPFKGLPSTYDTTVFSCEIPRSYYRNSYVDEREDKKIFFSWIKISKKALPNKVNYLGLKFLEMDKNQ